MGRPGTRCSRPCGTLSLHGSDGSGPSRGEQGSPAGWIERAKAQEGRYRGRKPSYNRGQLQTVQNLIGQDAGTSAIARSTGLTRQTVSQRTDLSGDASPQTSREHTPVSSNSQWNVRRGGVTNYPHPNDHRRGHWRDAGQTHLHLGDLFVMFTSRTVTQQELGEVIGDLV